MTKNERAARNMVICGGALLLGSALAGSLTAHAAEGRSYVAARFALQLKGTDVGLVQGFEGGGAFAEVVNEASGPNSYPKKHLGSVRYDDILVEVGLDANPMLFQWVADMWDARATRRDGAVVSADFNNKVQQRVSFNEALLTGVTIPALDAASKDAGSIKLRVSPERTTIDAGDGSDLKATAKSAQKAFRTSSFRFELGDIDTSKVSKIDAFTVKQTVAHDSVGEQREVQKEPAKLEFPNLELSVSGATAQAFRKWHEEFLIKGNTGEAKEKSGAIVFLGPDLKTELARVSLAGVGVVRVKPEDTSGGAEKAAAVRVELYVEKMGFSMPGVKAVRMK